MKKFLLIVLSLLTSIVSYSLLAEQLTVENAWIRAMPPTSRVVPIYLTMKNTGDQPIKLLAINSPNGRIELHQTIMKNGLMRMTPVEKIMVDSHGQTTMAPGGYHGMMMNFTQGVPAKGDSVPLTLTFNNGEKLTIMAAVKMNSDETMHHHHH
ncbi:copper chaperone PCu(A)C [Parashewanella curva]|uniref:Copper chaperone PCu(A)C n=1 Tax=Parashewanella curva TaxID=2338552 RepID=A0A3L8PW12_9GAMM|nr:copper chaperone PCu(A)C [Parashewanella curva]RLV58783.1 copper chaperone PCu(A)C [Parashewanella curva]